MDHTSDREAGRAGRVWVQPVASVAAWAIAVVFILRFFDAMRFIFLGILAACTLASALRPLRDKMPGPHGLRAVLAGLVPIFFVAGIISLISYFLAARIREEIARWPETEENINQFLDRVNQRVHWDMPLTVEDIIEQIVQYFAGVHAPEIATATAGIVSTLLIGLAFLFFGSIYLLLGSRKSLLYPVLHAFPSQRRTQLHAAVDDLEVRLRWWVIGTLISMTVVGVFTGIGYTIMGLQMAVPLALLAALSEIVPTVGPLFSFLVATLFAATQSTRLMIAVIALYLVVQTIEAYILIPMVMKKAIHMPPVVTLFTVVLWGRVLGPIGLLLALPINLTVVSFADRLLRRRD